MQNKVLHLFLFVVLVAFFSQCSENVQEEELPKTMAQFNIRYLESEQQLRGQASFVQGDSIENAQPIKIEGGVAFMSSATNERPLPNGTIRYENTLNGPLSLPFRFGFKLPGNEQAKEVSFSMPLVGDYTIGRASKEQGLQLTLSSPLSREESLLLLFTDPNQEARTIIRPGPIEDLKIFIPSDALLHFIPGSYRVYLVKSKNIKGAEQGVDYQSIIEYYSKEVDFELTE